MTPLLLCLITLLYALTSFPSYFVHNVTLAWGFKHHVEDCNDKHNDYTNRQHAHPNRK